MPVTFAVSSCQYPPGFLDAGPADASNQRLLARIRSGRPGSPQMALLLGDQVYIDATAGLFDPTAHHDRYVRPYVRLKQMRALRAIQGPGFPVRRMLDDHEIEDNWEPIEGERQVSAALVQGRRSFLTHAAFPGEELPDPEGDASLPLWTDFEMGGIPFFLADTRTERTPRTARTIESARIMSETQFGKLLAWLDAHGHRDVPKFIGSPSILLPRRLRATHRSSPASALRSDAWDGYPLSLHRLLASIADRKLQNVVFLSGDEHLSCDAHAHISGPRGAAHIRSIHSSPMYGPFPFANSQPADLVARESFRFIVGNDEYRCTVSTAFGPAGDGFALVTADNSTGAWQVDCQFVR